MKNYTYLLSFTLFICWVSMVFGQNNSLDLEIPTSPLSGEVLYNGIVLPKQWPPRYAEPEQPTEMPVPYLSNKPPKFPIDIGRQLFVDDFLIAETNLFTSYHYPTFYVGNPILYAENDWEIRPNRDGIAAPYSDGVWFDELTQKFKLWYRASGRSTCYAESIDGFHWNRPLLGIYGETNIIDTTRSDSQTIWLDKKEKDPLKRYKMFQTRSHPLRSKFQFVLKYSSDGINWSEGKAMSGSIDDRSTAFYNPFRDVWVLSLRYWKMKYEDQMKKIDNPPTGRSRTYLENKDPEMAVSLAHYIRDDIHDKYNYFWFASSDKEPRNPHFPNVNPAIYNFDAIPYESIMLGFISVWEGPENPILNDLGITKRNELLLGYSRDGFHFSRPSYQPFIGVDEDEGAWNNGNVQSVNGAPMIVGDSLYFFVSGRRKTKGHIGDELNISTGLATLRRDGFVSMDAGDKEGFLTTEKLNFNGKYLFLNADVSKGKLIVEILDEDGRPINGYERQNCVAMQNDNSTRKMIMWDNQKDLNSLIGEDVRFKFYLSNGELYSFWVSAWETGESNGYTAGGGPGLSIDGVDKK